MPMMRGFSLVEVMMAMVIASIGVLGVTTGTVSSLSNNLLARERIAATNLALDVIESWQASTSDTLPALQCTAGTVVLVSGGNSTCTMVSQEVNTEFTITISTQSVQAPMQPAVDATPVMADLYAGLRISALLIDKNSTNFTDQMHIYAGTAGYGLFESNDSGITWSRITATGYSIIHALTQYNSAMTIVVAGTDSYAIANTNSGGSWGQLKSGLPSNANILAVATDAYSTLFAGLDVYTNVNNGGGYRSLDTGASWSQKLGGSGDPYTVYALAVDNYVYAGTNAGIRYSTNDGTSWASQAAAPTGSLDVYALAYSSSNGTLYAGTSGGVSASTDNGASWSVDSVNGHKITALFVADDGTTVTAGTENFGVYTDLCGGATPVFTTGMTTKPQLHVYSIAVPPVASPTLFYAGTDVGLFKATVSGGVCSGWTPVDTGIGLVPQEKIVT
ncbi:MAG: prepilin-type N-terminal cleavage/methylation domain-containing protein, partial [Mariprofundales bacterium]